MERDVNHGDRSSSHPFGIWRRCSKFQLTFVLRASWPPYWLGSGLGHREPDCYRRTISVWRNFLKSRLAKRAIRDIDFRACEPESCAIFSGMFTLLLSVRNLICAAIVLSLHRAAPHQAIGLAGRLRRRERREKFAAHGCAGRRKARAKGLGRPAPQVMRASRMCLQA